MLLAWNIQLKYSLFTTNYNTYLKSGIKLKALMRPVVFSHTQLNKYNHKY